MIFVFGSNLAGRHGAGAALYAASSMGAKYGVAEGRTGNSYAIPTKDSKLSPLSLEEIKKGVDKFLLYAREHPELDFNVTRIGCGLAGYSDKEIAPFFQYAPENCYLAYQWVNILLNRE